MPPINIAHLSMTPSPAHSKWSRPLPEDHGYESPTIGIRIEGPEGAEVAMQVSLDGVQTVDGSHAEQYPSQEGPLNPLFDDNAHLVNWGDRQSLGICNRSPASSPPCSPSPSSGSNTPESGYLSGDSLYSPESIHHAFQEVGGPELNLEDRLFEREQHIPSLLLQETTPDIFTSSGVFSEEELHFLNSSSIVDQNSPSPQALSLDIPPLTPPSGSISEPAPSTSNRPKRRHYRRRSERALLPENPPLTRRRSLRSARRASSSSPYPSPHSSPSSREPIFLPQSLSPSNSTSQSMDDNRTVGQAVYRHASSSASSLIPSPRGTHASPHTASYSPEHRPQSPSLVHRTLAREGRKKSRSISPFDSGSGHHGHRPRSSSRTRPDVFTQNVPTYLTKNKNVGGSGAGASSSVPAGSSSSVLHKSYPLRMANFETGRQQQPVVQAGGVQRPSSLVRTSYLPDDDMSSSSNEDAEMEDEANQQGHEGSRSRRRSATPASSSDDESPPPPLPPKSSSAARRISAGNEKGKMARGFDEGADGMPIDARACEPVAPDTDSEDEIDPDEDYRRSRKSQDDLSAQRRSSYPSVHHYPHNYGSPTSYPSSFNSPSAHVPSSLREEVSRSRVQSRTRSHSHSPSRHDRSRSLSRARYSPMATRVTTTSQSNDSRPSSCSRPPAEDHPLRTRRSTRLSKSPARANVGEAGHVPERQADQRYLQCCCGYTAQSRPDLHGHLKRNTGACREIVYHDGGSQQVRASKVSPTRTAGTRRRNSDASASYSNYQPQRRQDLETEEDDGAASDFEGDEEDDDYETGSQRGRRGKKRASPSRGSYNYNQPLQGSPLKRSAVLLSGPNSPVSESKLPIGQLQPSPRSYPTHSRSASDSNVRARSSAYHNTGTQGSPSSRSPNHSSTPLDAAAFSADAATDSHNGTTAPVGGTIVNGVGAMSPNRNQYRSVGSRNIDNASEKRRKGEKRFKCKFEDCGKMFTTNQNCQIHERKHVGDAPYRCGCGYAVAGRSDLVRHLRKKNVNPECKELARDDPRQLAPII